MKISDEFAKFLEILKDNPQDNQYGKYAFRRNAIHNYLATINETWTLIGHIVHNTSLITRPAQGWYDFENVINKFQDHIDEKTKERVKEEDQKLVDSLKKIASENIDLEVKTSEYVPEVDPTYVSWGNTQDLDQIISNPSWFPVYIVGETGNGKTAMIEQSCAKAGRELFRVQIHEETDQDDMIGGFRLVEGNMVFEKGPVLMAMERGAVLLLDEIDRGTNKLMCLQGILEGKPYLIKKTGDVVKPAPGFNVIAAANTKGKGDVQGRYSGATVLDEAFLERFYVTMEQEYPSISIERRILRNNMIRFNCLDEEFLEHLVQWSDQIRQTYLNEGSDELVTTRRLCQIVSTFSVFKDRSKSVSLALNRFDEDTRSAFLDTYYSIDPSKYSSEDDTEKKNDVKSESYSDLFKDKKIVITGSGSINRAGLESYISKVGGKIQKTISQTTDFLIVGKKPGTEKMKKVKIVSGCQIIQMDDLIEEIGNES